MKKSGFFLTLLLLLFVVSGVNSQTVDEVIDNHIKAIGGFEK